MLNLQKQNALNLADLLKKVDKIITFWFAKVHTRKRLLNFLEKQNGFKWLSHTFGFFLYKIAIDALKLLSLV